MATRFDMLVIPAFLEFIYFIRFAVFMPKDGLLTHASNIFLFNPIKEKKGKPKMNLIVLAIAMTTREYLDKTVLNLGSGT